MSDFNVEQMKRLLGKDNVSIVYLITESDYWIKQEEFCTAFRAVPLTDNVVVHVQFEGLSLTHSLVVPAIEKIISETGRDPSTVYVFSPNSIRHDASWENIFWRQYFISDEFLRAGRYWENSPDLEDNFKTWGLFVGRRTTPRLLALHDIWHDPALKEQCLLSAMNQPVTETMQVFDNPEKIYDTLDQWLTPVENKLQRILQHNNFREFCRNLPIQSIDGYSVVDQYTGSPESNDNRDAAPSVSLINNGGKYLFEITFETMTRGLTFTPSEKTVRTIVAEKPLVVYAPKDFLLKMRELGFQTFSSLWDESYDQLEGPDRYAAIMKIVKQVCALPREQQLALYQSSRNICKYNRRRLQNFVINNGQQPNGKAIKRKI